MTRSALGIVFAVCVVVGIGSHELAPRLAQGTAQGQGASQGQGTARPQQDPQKPVFRTGTNFVQVDAYPRRDGKIVDDLKAEDLQVLEDGKPQQIEALEFIRVNTNTPEAERRDPNSQGEGNRLAADPRNRVFVVYLDHYFGSLYGSHNIQRPLIDMLNRMLAPNDLFGIATAHTRPQDLLLARQTKSLEEQLAKYWTWGQPYKNDLDLEPEEEYLYTCYGKDLPRDVIMRLREERALLAIDRLMDHLGAIREARKIFIAYTRGWPLYRPNVAAANSFLKNWGGSMPRVGVTGTGQLSIRPPDSPGLADWSRCEQEVNRAFRLDNYTRFRDLIDHARQNNVTFYPVNPNGLTGARDDVLRSLANETDGFVSLTNDLGALLKQITDDVSAYYVLGYSSSAKPDGQYHRIEVKVNRPDITVKARRGYFSATIKEGMTVDSATPSPERFEDAVGVLSRLRPSAELFVSGAVTAADLAIVAELASVAGIWSNGGDVVATITDDGGTNVQVRGRIDAGLRSTTVRVPKPPSAAPYRVTVRVSSGTEELTERLEIRPGSGKLLGSPLLFRATPSPVSALRPVADMQFRRTERAHVEWPILAALDRREARLLSKDGKPLPIPVSVTERDQNGTQTLAADVNLAPLAVGDYVIELTAGAGGATERQFVAIRIKQ